MNWGYERKGKSTTRDPERGGESRHCRRRDRSSGEGKLDVSKVDVPLLPPLAKRYVVVIPTARMDKAVRRWGREERLRRRRGAF